MIGLLLSYLPDQNQNKFNKLYKIDIITYHPPRIHKGGRSMQNESLEQSSLAEVPFSKQFYAVEQITDHQFFNINGQKALKFLVKWKGYSAAESTWEPEENLTLVSIVSIMVVQYKKKHKLIKKNTKVQQASTFPFISEDPANAQLSKQSARITPISIKDHPHLNNLPQQQEPVIQIDKPHIKYSRGSMKKPYIVDNNLSEQDQMKRQYLQKNMRIYLQLLNPVKQNTHSQKKEMKRCQPTQKKEYSDNIKIVQMKINEKDPDDTDYLIVDEKGEMNSVNQAWLYQNHPRLLIKYLNQNGIINHGLVCFQKNKQIKKESLQKYII